MLYDELTTGYRSHGGQRKRFKDQLKKSLVHCHLYVDTWETLALDRSSWCSSTKSGVHEFELHRINEAMAWRQRRKEVPLTVSDGTSSYICHVCGRVCRAKIGLISHLSTHWFPDRQSSSFMMDSNNMIGLLLREALDRLRVRLNMYFVSK